MSELREMLKEFEEKYVCNENFGGRVYMMRADNDLIRKMLEEVANRIEAIEQRQKVEDEE